MTLDFRAKLSYIISNLTEEVICHERPYLLKTWLQKLTVPHLPNLPDRPASRLISNQNLSFIPSSKDRAHVHTSTLPNCSLLSALWLLELWLKAPFMPNLLDFILCDFGRVGGGLR